MPPAASQSPSLRSVFVTVLGWTVIVASALASVISFFTILMLVAGSYGTSGGLTFEGLCIIAGPPVTLVAGIGLLRRRQWARIYLVALLLCVLAYNCHQIVRGTTPEQTVTSADGVLTTTLASPAQYSVPVIALCIALLVKLFSGSIRAEFGTSSRSSLLTTLTRKKWRVGHQGRDMMYYEEKRDGTWQRIEISGEMLMGRAHHVIYFDSPERWQSYPEWARHRRDEIIARIKSEFREPDYEYHGNGEAARPTVPQPPALAPVPLTPAPAVPATAAAHGGADRVTPRQLAALATFIAVFISLAAGMSWLVNDGIGKGETAFPSKRASSRRTVSRQEEPAMFWIAIGLYGGIAVLASCASFWFIREGSKVIVKFRRQSVDATRSKPSEKESLTH